MELREYLGIRRAYNLVRQGVETRKRLTFAELAILCRIKVLNRPMNTSEIADYQHALRPTMTHRAKHLSSLGFIKRTKGSSDRRNVACELTDEGLACIDELCGATCETLRSAPEPIRMTLRRACRTINAMGSLNIISGDLVLLSIMICEGQDCTISSLVALSGLLQPTVSMSVASLVRDGMVERIPIEGSGSRYAGITLTEQGREKAKELAARIEELVVRR